MQLTKRQQQAVEYNKGPLLIIAGAGTGKTTVLVEKVKYLIKKNLAKPEEILALTFTDKAAREMEERVDKALPYGYFQTWISTFHSFADRILRDEASHIGLSPAYKLQTQAQSILYLKNNLFLFKLNYFRPLGNPNKFIEGLIQHFSRLRDEDVSFNQYIGWAENQKISKDEDKTECEKNIELAKAYKKFQSLKIKDNVMDFSDLIFYTLKLFRERKNILKKYKSQFKYLLVDEFQDTNIAQYELIKLLAPPLKNPHLSVIGDDNQSIYKFRGASISNILQFMDDYKTAKKVVLLENYRSNQTILDHAYQLIKHNDPDTLEAKLGISKDLKSIREKGGEKTVDFFLAERAEGEAEYAGKEIIKFKKQYQWRDFAVLVRANNHAEPFVKMFQRLGIPYQFLGPGMLFKQPEVKDLIAYLKVLYNISDSPSFFRVLNMDIFNLDQKDVARLTSFTRNTHLSLFETVEIYLSFFYPEFYKKEFAHFKKYLFLIKEQSRKKLYQIYKLVTRSFSLLKKETAGQILYYFLEDSGYLSKLMSYKSEKEEKIALNISKFFDKLKTYETEEENASVFAAVDYIEMSMELGESPLASDIDWSDYNAVNILTVHAAKGLEFPVVFLVNLTSERFPTRERREQIPIPEPLIKEILPVGNYHLEEERRLFYVGLTRTKDKLYLTASYYYAEGKRERKISPFVVETLGEEVVLKKREEKTTEKTQLSIFDFKKIEEITLKADIPAGRINTFSFSQLDTYQSCPLKYKYQYVLKIPTLPSAAASFGQTIHQTLQKFYRLYRLNQNPSLKLMIELYQDSWIPLGYTSKGYERKMKKEGEKILEEFYKKYHSKNLRILDLEKWFKIKIGNNIFISGFIDRVDLLDKDRLEIIDYKTGKQPERKELEHSLQLGIYALAASDKGLYRRKVNDIVLSFHFLQDGEKISIKTTDQHLSKIRKDVKETAQKINQSNFEPKTGPWCDFCPFKINCEAWQ
jgi:DNA helicase-2/ATP-dependent DNA helicase PcrA